MKHLTIPYFLVVERGKDRAQSVMAQIKDTVDAETGQAHEWRHDHLRDVFELIEAKA